MGLREIVHENLDHAVDNEYAEILTWLATDIALDLLAFAADVEDCSADELLPHVESWLEAQKSKINQPDGKPGPVTIA